MKVICTQENFKKAVFYAERVVSKHTTLPILNNILFEAQKGGLTLFATNLEIGITVKIGAKIEKEGKITIPAKLIGNLLNSLPEGSNVFLEKAEQGLKIQSGSVKALIKGLPASDFPLIPKKKDESQIKINTNKLKKAINQIITSAAINETRQELTGINLILKEKELFLAATDSFRLAESRISLDEKNTSKNAYENLIKQKNNVIIPAATMGELNKILSPEEDEEIRVTIEEGQIFFENNGVVLVSRLINGKYPEYKHIMPKKFDTRLVGSKNIIQNATRIASLFSAGKTSEVVLKNNTQEKKVSIEARSVETGENTTELDLDVSGPSQEIIFNARYLLDGLNAISTEKTAILINSGSSPAALKEIDEQKGEVREDYVYILMPIKN